jgi:hypothetical protein
MNFNSHGKLSNGEEVFAEGNIRFLDKGKGRYPNWKGSMQLIGIALEVGGHYTLDLADGRKFEITIEAADVIPPNKCFVTFHVHGDMETSPFG